MTARSPLGWRPAKSIRTLVDELLGELDLPVRGGKLFPALFDHELSLLELVQGVHADLACVFHKGIVPETEVFAGEDRPQAESG
jgi:hypothetical protein